MLKILAFLTKRQDLETRAFLEHYESKHVPLIRRLAPTPLVYQLPRARRRAHHR